MTQPAGSQSAARDFVHAELRTLRETITGIDGSLVATSDGLLIAHDIPDQEPARLAALVSTTLSLARQAVRETGRGEFREALARGTAGYLMVYAAGGNAVVAIIGDAQLNVGVMQYQAREAIERITARSADFARWSGAAGPTAGDGEPPQGGSESHFSELSPSRICLSSPGSGRAGSESATDGTACRTRRGNGGAAPPAGLPSARAGAATAMIVHSPARMSRVTSSIASWSVTPLAAVSSPTVARPST